MVLFKSFALSALLGLIAVLPVKATGSSSTEFRVTVGGPGGVIAYDPCFVNAHPGDVITFVFKQKNHTVTQSTFEHPCTPLPNGFDTDFIPVPENNTNGPFPEVKLRVNDTNPVWMFCEQDSHCQRGMVFAINPGDQLPAFQAAARNTAPAPTSSAAPLTPSPSGQDHKVLVGGFGKNLLMFQPANITAKPGDTVTFEFHQKNHTATRSSFDAPCRPLADTSKDHQVGFESGFVPVAENATKFPTFTIRVNDTNPIWAFCRQGDHCGEGMVFSVNANESSSNNFAAFHARAMQINGTDDTRATKGNGAGSVHLGGTGIAVGFAAAILGLML